MSRIVALANPRSRKSVSAASRICSLVSLLSFVAFVGMARYLDGRDVGASPSWQEIAPR